MNDFPKIPENWNELVELRDYLTDCNPIFLRKNEDREKYSTHQNSIPREEFLKMITSKFNDERIALIENIFPHTNVLAHLPDVMHYCLWSLEGELPEAKIKEGVEKKFKNAQWISMTRKEGKVSVAEIWHSHIYIQK
jgi:hypothetical protein